MFNAFVLFCIFLSLFLFMWCWEELKAEICKRSDIKSDQRRAYNRVHKQEEYRKDYWIRRNRENTFNGGIYYGK